MRLGIRRSLCRNGLGQFADFVEGDNDDPDDVAVDEEPQDCEDPNNVEEGSSESEGDND